MFYTFSEYPTIQDNGIQYDQNSIALSQQDRDLLKNAEMYRQGFRSVLTKDNMEKMKEGKFSVLEHQPNLENYLKCNVDMMRIFVIKRLSNPVFSYGLFLSKRKVYTTEKNSVEEACACEIVMARYMYSLSFALSCNQAVQRIRCSILGNFQSQDVQLVQQTNLDISSCLKLMYLSQTPVHRLCNVMEDLLKSLVTNQETLLPELRMTCIISYRNILDCGTNFIFLEKLRQLKEYDIMSKVSRASFSKANEAYQRLSQQGEDVNGDIVEYCQLAMTYFKIYGIWCILQVNEKSIKYEQFKVKNYNVLTAENFKIANEIVRVSNQMIALKPQKDSYDEFCSLFFQKCLVPTLERVLQIYTNANTQVKSPDELFMGLDDSFDYYEEKLKQKQ